MEIAASILVVSPLGIDPYHDGGAWFKVALEAWASAAFVPIVRRDDAIALVRRWLPFLR